MKILVLRDVKKPAEATWARFRHAVRALFGLRVGRYVVRGDSMTPALRSGDRVLVLRGIHRWAPPRPGEVVLARVPAAPDLEIVKRVTARRRDPDGDRYVLLGDNPTASTDSRHFGPVPGACLTGRVWLRYWPDERRGRPR